MSIEIRNKSGRSTIIEIKDIIKSKILLIRIWNLLSTVLFSPIKKIDSPKNLILLYLEIPKELFDGIYR